MYVTHFNIIVVSLENVDFLSCLNNAIVQRHAHTYTYLDVYPMRW